MSYPDPEAAGLSTPRLHRAYRFLDEAVQTGKLPGAALLVARHGIPMAPRPFGKLHPTRDAPPIRPNTIFLIASITKPVVVSALMLLVERGTLLLDEPAAMYVPEFGTRSKETITLRHLMTHTSGLPDMLPENDELRADHAPLAEFVRRIYDLEPSFASGTEISYQSMGIAILGEILERVTGTPLRDFLRRQIFDPLEMDDSALGAAGLPADRIAHVDVGEEMAAKDWNWNTPYWHNFGAPWGGMFSTVGDLFRYGQAFLDSSKLGGAPIFSGATVDAMTRDQTGALPALPAETGHSQTYGLGWRRFPAAQGGLYGNLVSPGTFGHGGATGTVLWIDPARQMVCVLLTTEPLVHSAGLLARCSNLVAACAL
jgi:CubicO group peptidase (beta-lactamase class C family)